MLDVTRDSVACVGHEDSPSLFTSDLITQQASKDAMAIPDTVGVTQECGTDRLCSACSFSRFWAVTNTCGLHHSFRGHSAADYHDDVHGSGAVVVTKWNNPTCSTAFHHLEDGRPFRLEVHWALRSYPTVDRTFSRYSHCPARLNRHLGCPTFQQLPTRVAKLAARMIPQSAALNAE